MAATKPRAGLSSSPTNMHIQGSIGNCSRRKTSTCVRGLIVHRKTSATFQRLWGDLQAHRAPDREEFSYVLIQQPHTRIRLDPLHH